MFTKLLTTESTESNRSMFILRRKVVGNRPDKENIEKRVCDANWSSGFVYYFNAFFGVGNSRMDDACEYSF